MALRRRLVGSAQPLEDLPLPRHAGGERQGHGRLYALHAGVRRIESARPPRHLLAERVEYFRMGARRSYPLLKRGGAAQRRAVVRQLPGERDRGGQQVAFNELVRDADGYRPLHRQELPADDHVERGLHADQPRQPLRAAGAGDDAQRHLGQAEARAGRHEPDVARQRHFQPAPRGNAVNGRDHRLAGSLDLVEYRGQGSRAGRRRRVELADVRAAAEHASRAGDHDGRHAFVGQRFHDAVAERRAHREAQAVDRRVVESQQGNAVMALDSNGSGHTIRVYFLKP